MKSNTTVQTHRLTKLDVIKWMKEQDRFMSCREVADHFGRTSRSLSGMLHDIERSPLCVVEVRPNKKTGIGVEMRVKSYFTQPRKMRQEKVGNNGGILAYPRFETKREKLWARCLGVRL